MSWEGKSKGGLVGYKIFVFIIRRLGVRFAYFILWFVSWFFFIKGGKEKQAMKTFYLRDLKVDKTLYPDEFEMVRDSVKRSLANFGENNHFLQSANLTYTWPLKKIPVLSFINLTTKYQTTFDWQRAPLTQDSLGNTIQNSRNISWNGSFNMKTLYNKVPYFRKVNQKSRNVFS